MAVPAAGADSGASREGVDHADVGRFGPRLAWFLLVRLYTDPYVIPLEAISMKRRQFVGRAAASALVAGIARPAIVRAASTSTLKFVPYADLALLDPLVSAFVTRNRVH